MPGFQFIEVPADADGPALKGAMWYPCAAPPGDIDLGEITANSVSPCAGRRIARSAATSCRLSSSHTAEAPTSTPITIWPRRWPMPDLSSPPSRTPATGRPSPSVWRNPSSGRPTASA
jgi:hypothetical protein